MRKTSSEKKSKRLSMKNTASMIVRRSRRLTVPQLRPILPKLRHSRRKWSQNSRYSTKARVDVSSKWTTSDLKLCIRKKKISSISRQASSLSRFLSTCASSQRLKRRRKPWHHWLGTWRPKRCQSLKWLKTTLARRVSKEPSKKMTGRMSKTKAKKNQNKRLQLATLSLLTENSKEMSEISRY